MIQKGIIAQVIDKYNYKVRIPKYDKVESATYSTKTDDLSSGIVCTVPGIEVVYVEGDVVLLSFENGELSKPVILGLLYREEKKDSDILVNGVDKSLSGIKEDIDKLNSQSLYTHLKYSDDNGVTFTSLFSSQNYESIVGGEIVCQPYFDDDSAIGIKIDKATKAISWSVLDENNQDITDEIEIETIVFDSNKNIIKRYRSRDNRLITINNSSQIDGDLYLTYRIFTSKAYLDTLHVRLSSDKEPFGVRVGDYVGLYLSFNSTPSTTPADYSWFPIASGAAIDAEINRKIAALTAEMNELLNEFKEEVDENFVTIFYRDVDWTQTQVDTYCQPGYEGTWERDPIYGYMDEVKTGNTLYISVHNTGESSSTDDDSYGQLQIRAISDAAAGQDVEGIVIAYIVSGEIALDALARFKSSLLQPGDETLIYGGHITTGRISDSTGKNFIQLSAEERAPAGQVEFKDTADWADANQGLQWDSSQGQLNIKGNINASSLTIISGDSSYDGAAAINISGYDIEIEKNGIDEVEGVSVYLYPILYHNGVQVPTTEVDYSHFIWYQDDDTIGTEGDGDNSGRYLATYGHNYRVIYDFDDGAVGGGIEVIDRTIDPSKYITKIDDNGITIHPEVWTGEANHIQLDGNGMELFDNNNNSIAKYGGAIRVGKATENHLEIDNNGISILNNTNSLANFGNTARIGLNNSSRFLMNNNSLEAYDNNNVKYFEVNNNGLSWGTKTAATAEQVSSLADDLADKADISDVEDAAKTATNYISTITGGGISVHDENDEDNYAKIDSNGLSVYKHETDIAVFGENTRIGKLNNASKVVLSPDSIGMYDANNINVFSSKIPEIAEEGSSSVSVELEGIIFESTSSHPAHQSSSSTGSYPGYDIFELANVAANEKFTLYFWVRASFGKPIDSPRWDIGFEAQVYVSLEFTKGVSKTYNNIVLKFNQNNNLPGSSTLTINNISYNATTGIINCGGYTFFNDTDLTAYSRIQITTITYVHHNIKYPLTIIKGDCCLNGDTVGNSSILGQCFIKPTTKLSSLIQALEWDYGEESVVVSISLFNSSYSVGSNEPAYVSASIEPYDSTNPVIWTSSNENVFTVRKKGYSGSGGSLVYNYITAVGSVGDVATLTCYINCGGTLVKDSATVTITQTTPQLPDE